MQAQATRSIDGWLFGCYAPDADRLISVGGAVRALRSQEADGDGAAYPGEPQRETWGKAFGMGSEGFPRSYEFSTGAPYRFFFRYTSAYTARTRTMPLSTYCQAAGTFMI